MNNIYHETTLFTSFVYPRYFNEIQRFSFIPNVVYTPCYIDVDREDELWFQYSKYDSDLNLVIPDNNVVVVNASGEEVYNSQTPHYYSKKLDGGGNPYIVYYLNDLLDDEQCFIRFSCGTYIGNTNTKERIVPQKTTNPSEEFKNVTLAYKRIWGFEPDKASDSIEEGIIDGYSKKKYAVFIKVEDSKTKYIPTVNGIPITDNDILTIVDDKASYREYYDEHESLIVSD